MQNKKLTLEEKLALVRTKSDSVSHITLDEEKCAACKNKTCLLICPAKTYEEIEGRIVVHYENCLECGACRFACSQECLRWENPRGKFGVTFLNG